MTAKDVYVTSTIPLSLGQNLNSLKKLYLGAEVFFGYSNSEFIDDNSFHLKDKKII